MTEGDKLIIVHTSIDRDKHSIAEAYLQHPNPELDGTIAFVGSKKYWNEDVLEMDDYTLLFDVLEHEVIHHVIVELFNVKYDGMIASCGMDNLFRLPGYSRPSYAVSLQNLWGINGFGT